MPQLDSLRAIAVLLVIIHHGFTNHISSIYPSLGTVGVQAFFVLSGFLITSLLLGARGRICAGESDASGELRTFYIRRAFRIFPLYYSVAILVIVFNVEGVEEFWPYIMTYTSNIWMSQANQIIPVVTHFWSLAVEEQFYLVWPWIVLLLPARWSLGGACAMILVAVLTRAYYALAWTLVGDDVGAGLASWMSTFANLDSLGAGALLAILLRRFGFDRIKGPFRSVLGVSLLGLAACYAAYRFASHLKLEIVLANLCLSGLFASVVLACANGVKGLSGKILDIRQIQYLGRISYGLYVFHPLVIGGAHLVMLTHPVGEEMRAIVIFLSILLTVVLASLSWAYLEGPFNRLKNRFSSQGAALARQAASR